jgi:hypothetical protein
MARLNQIIAIEKGVKSQAYAELTNTHQQVQKLQLLMGISRTYRPINDEGERFPDESTKVQLSAEKVLRDTADMLARMFDITATKDWGNTLAKADVVVNGNVLLKAVPVTYLLFLEKQLVDLQTFVKKLPVLDQAEQWTFDPAADTYATSPVETTRTKKILRNHVKAEATPQHPAQVEVYTEDVVVGYWNTVKFSGALPAARVNELLERVHALQDAVKFAREEANNTETTDQRVGAPIFDYLFA